MKTSNKTIIQTVLESDQTISGHQRESALAILEGETPPTIALLLKQSEVAKLLNVSRQTVWSMVKRGLITPIKLTANMVRYKRDEILDIVNGKMVVA